jgi:hypothetical protein
MCKNGEQNTLENIPMSRAANLPLQPSDRDEGLTEILIDCVLGVCFGALFSTLAFAITLVLSLQGAYCVEMIQCCLKEHG